MAHLGRSLCHVQAQGLMERGSMEYRRIVAALNAASQVYRAQLPYCFAAVQPVLESETVGWVIGLRARQGEVCWRLLSGHWSPSRDQVIVEIHQKWSQSPVVF